MKRLIAFLSLVSVACLLCGFQQQQILSPILQGAPAASGNTFTVVHAPSTFVTDCTAVSSCSIPVTSTGSGNLLEFSITNTSGGADFLTAIGNAACTAATTPSACCTGNGTGTCGTGVAPAGSHLNNATIGAVSLGYILSSTSGLTAIPATFGVSSNYLVSYSEVSYTPGPISLDGSCNTAQDTTGSTSHNGPSLTGTTGTKDYMVQWMVVSTGDVTAIGAPYGSFAGGTGLHSGAGNQVNGSNFSAPAFTTGTSDTSVAGGCAFK